MTDDKWLGTKALAEIWECTQRTARMWVLSEGIPHRELPGGSVQVRESVARAWIKQTEKGERNDGA